MQDNEPINLTYGQMTDMVERIEQIPPLTGASAPTASTPAFHLGQRYINTTTGEAYCCTGLPASGSTGYVWEREATKGYVDGKVLQNAGAPTASTVGTVGQLLEDTTNGKLYICTAVVPGTDPDPDTYTWVEVGGGGPTVVQTPGDSTTDVMSQNAVTSMIFADPATQAKIKIGAGASSSEGADAVEIGHNAGAIRVSAVAVGNNAQAVGFYSVALGVDTTAGSATNQGGVAIGAAASATGANAIALGRGASATAQGQFDIGARNNSGYNASNYRLLTGLYDGQSAHDAATKGQLDAAIINGGTTAPTTSTVGTVGTLYSYVDTSGQTPEPHLTVCTAVSGNTYTWTDLLSGIATALQTLNQGTGS